MAAVAVWIWGEPWTTWLVTTKYGLDFVLGMSNTAKHVDRALKCAMYYMCLCVTDRMCSVFFLNEGGKYQFCKRSIDGLTLSLQGCLHKPINGCFTWVYTHSVHCSVFFTRPTFEEGSLRPKVCFATLTTPNQRLTTGLLTLVYKRTLPVQHTCWWDDFLPALDSVGHGSVH